METLFGAVGDSNIGVKVPIVLMGDPLDKPSVVVKEIILVVDFVVVLRHEHRSFWWRKHRVPSTTCQGISFVDVETDFCANEFSTRELVRDLARNWTLLDGRDEPSTRARDPPTRP